MSKTKKRSGFVSVAVDLPLDLTQSWAHERLSHQLVDAARAIAAGLAPAETCRPMLAQALNDLAQAVHARGTNKPVQIAAMLADTIYHPDAMDRKEAGQKALEMVLLPPDEPVERAVLEAWRKLRKARSTQKTEKPIAKRAQKTSKAK